MKKTIFTRFAAATLILAAVACQKENFEGDNAPQTQENLVPMTITASLEAGTKAALQEGGKVFWEKEDALTVLAVDKEGKQSASYEFTTKGEGEKAEFTGMVGDDTINLSEGMYAVYPPTSGSWYPYAYAVSSGKATYSGFPHTINDAGELQMFLPSTQFASSNAAKLYSLSAGKVIGEERTLTMKNVGGLIAITLPDQPDYPITSVTLYGNNDEVIAGRVTANFDSDGIPVVSEVIGSNMIHLIPPTKNGKFAPGTYYINVPPVVFTKGLTLLLTSESNFSILRSADTFVVERNQISPFPQIPILDFNGKFIEWQFIDDYNVNGGSYSTTLQYYVEKEGKKVATTLPNSSNNALSGTFTFTDGTYDITVKSNKLFVNGGQSGGLGFAGEAGCYMTFPQISNYALSKVSIRSGQTSFVTTSGLSVVTKPDDNEDYTTLTNCNPWSSYAQGGMDHIWNFSADPTTEYALMTTRSTPVQACRIQTFRLYYVPVADVQNPTVTPLITGINSLEPVVDYENNNVTMKASFSAVDYASESQFSCGFDYKLTTAEDWKSVECEIASFEFSANVSFESRGEYEYRPWVKFKKSNGSIKKVDGEETVIDMSTVVLNLVFDESFYKLDENGNPILGTNGNYKSDPSGNYLTREWQWNTNGGNKTVYANGRENTDYNFKYYGKNYAFNFFGLAGLQKYDEKGNPMTKFDSDKQETVDDTYSLEMCPTLRVISGSGLTIGLCLSYSPSKSHSWMKFPSIGNFRLTNVSAKLYEKERKSLGIYESVDLESDDTNYKGTPIGNALKTASQVDEFDFDFDPDETEKDVSYYLYTADYRLTIRNMTLTYEYAGN